MSLFDKLAPTADRLASAGERGGAVRYGDRSILSPTEVTIEGRRTLMCGSNNYFGLSFHPEVIAAATTALEQEGAGTTGSRAANGTYAGHRRLEQNIRRSLRQAARADLHDRVSSQRRAHLRLVRRRVTSCCSTSRATPASTTARG